MKRPRRFRRTLKWASRALVAACLLFAVLVISAWRCTLEGQIHPPIPRRTEHAAITREIKDYARPEDNTFLSYPEWYIVWSYQEKADYQANHLPSGFPYFGAIRQYWGSYCCISKLAKGKYSFNSGEQVMLVVIGTSFTAEYALKGLYEKTIGRVSEWTAGRDPVDEDRYASAVARDYADFVRVRPFYEYSFAKHLSGLWKQNPLWAKHALRKWERRAFLTTDYAIEAFYCWIIEKATHASYGYEPSETMAWVESADQKILNPPAPMKSVKAISAGQAVLSLPRYQEFTTRALELADHDARFVEIAGNSQIAMSVLVARNSVLNVPNVARVFSAPVLTDPGKERVVLVCDVPSLLDVLRALRAQHVEVEHIYDY